MSCSKDSNLNNVEEIKVEEKYKEYCADLILYGTKKWCLPKYYIDLKNTYDSTKLRKDDVWVVGYARSGTTMLQELVWLLQNNLNFTKAKEIMLNDRTIFFEWTMLRPRQYKDSLTASQIQMIGQDSSKLMEEIKEKRCIKTHLPISLLPQDLLTAGCKVIYIARNPKDVAASLFNFFDLMRENGYKISYSEHFDLFMRGYFAYSPFFENVKEGWDSRNEKNLKFIFYEDLVQKKQETINEIANFLGTQLTEQDMSNLLEHFDINNFKKNKAVHERPLRTFFENINKEREPDYIRKGIVGDWKNYHLDEEIKKKAEKWIDDNLKQIGITFSS